MTVARVSAGFRRSFGQVIGAVQRIGGVGWITGLESGALEPIGG